MRGAGPGALERGGAGAPSASEEEPRCRKREEAAARSAHSGRPGTARDSPERPGARPLPVRCPPLEAPGAGRGREGAAVRPGRRAVPRVHSRAAIFLVCLDAGNKNKLLMKDLVSLINISFPAQSDF